MRNPERSHGPETLAGLTPEQKLLEADDVVLIAGQGNVPLSEKIAFEFGKQLHKPITVFADGEKKHSKTGETLAGKDAFIIQSMQPNPDEKIMEYLIMLDAAKRAGAERIIAVFPYLAYMRQDKKDDSRVPISATLIPNISEKLELTRILTMELHNPAQQGFFGRPWDTIPSNFITVPYIESLNLPNPIIAAADAGGRARALEFSEQLGLEGIIQGDKQRDYQKRNHIKSSGFNGEVNGRDVIIVEDMIDTAGSIAGNYITGTPGFAQLLDEAGASSIRVVAPYPIFSTDEEGISAIDKIMASPITQIITTNSIELRPDAVNASKVTIDSNGMPKIKVLDVAPMLAEAIYRIHAGKSISEQLFLPKKSRVA